MCFCHHWSEVRGSRLLPDCLDTMAHDAPVCRLAQASCCQLSCYVGAAALLKSVEHPLLRLLQIAIRIWPDNSNAATSGSLSCYLDMRWSLQAAMGMEVEDINCYLQRMDGAEMLKRLQRQQQGWGLRGLGSSQTPEPKLQQGPSEQQSSGN